MAVFGEAIGRLAPGVLGDGDAGGGDIVLGAGSVDGMCEQLVAGTVEEGDVLVALGSTLVVWLTVPGWPDEVPGLWRAPHLAPGMAMLGGASNAGGMWADWVDRVVRPGEQDAAARPADVPIWWPWARGREGPLARPGPAGGPGRGRHLSRPASPAPRCLRGDGFRRPVHRGAGVGAQAPGRPASWPAAAGTVNRAWLQAVAEVLGQPVLPMAVPEGAALGAAWLARMAAGLETSISDGKRWARWSEPVEPRTDWAAAADERYHRWLEGLPGGG